MKKYSLITILLFLSFILMHCKKKSTSSTTTAAAAPAPKLYLGKYMNSNGYGGGLEFKENGVLVFSGPSGSVEGSYNMTSETAASISLGGMGSGDFTNNFSSFVNAQGIWNK